MRYKNIIFICILVIIAVFLLYRYFGNTPQSNKTTIQTQKQNTTSQASSQTQTNSEGEVTAKVTPMNVSDDKRTWQFQIVLDTHSGSLDTDLIKNAELIDERDNVLLPLSWNGTPLGGHHREGTLIFPSFQDRLESVTLQLKNIGGISERRFTWKSEAINLLPNSKQ